MSDSRWRALARPIIQDVIAKCRAENAGSEQLRQRIFEAYPFGERRYHPYRIWCDEIKRQLGERKLTKRESDDAKRYAEHVAKYGTVGE